MATNTIDTTHTHAYKLTVTYKEMGVDQSVDMNKTFSAKVNIVDINGLTVNNPYKNDTGTLKKTIFDNAMLGVGTTQFGSEVTTFTAISGENERVLNSAPECVKNIIYDISYIKLIFKLKFCNKKVIE